MFDNAHKMESQKRVSFIPALLLYIAIMGLLILSAPLMSEYPLEKGILISEWIFIFIPSLIFLRLFHVRPIRDLKITAISTKTTVGLIIVSISGIFLTSELVVFQNDIIPIPPAYMEMLRAIFTISERMEIHRAAFVFAVSPAICEELLFRGIILQGALGKVSRPGAVVLSGVLFGIFHLDPYRFLGTMVLGFIMGYLAIRACSLLASMTYHLTNNLLILLVMNLAPLKDIPWLTEEAHLPFGILILSAVMFLIGLRLVRARRNETYLQKEPEILRNISGDDP